MVIQHDSFNALMGEKTTVETTHALSQNFLWYREWLLAEDARFLCWLVTFASLV